MNIVFFIVLGILIIIAIPLKLKINFNFNFLENRGAISIKLFSFSIIGYHIKYENKKIILRNCKTTKQLDLDINKENINFANELQKQITKRLYLQNFVTYINFGIKDNPFAGAVIGSCIETALSIISSIIKFNKPTAQINYKTNTYYKKNMGSIGIDVSLSMSITNLALALLRTKININKKERIKYGRKAKASN